MAITTSAPVITLREGMGLHIVARDSWLPDELRAKMRAWRPRSELGRVIRDCFHYLPAQLAGELLERITSSLVIESTLAVKVFRLDGRVDDYGIVSRRVITTAGVTALAVAWASAAFDAKYMGLGTSSTAEATSDTGMVAEITTNHYTASVRPTCTHAESSNTVPLVGTHTQATAGDTIREHGLFTSATPGAVTLWDRSLTGDVALSVGESFQGTLTATLSAGG